jgi:hypothetical protein
MGSYHQFPNAIPRFEVRCVRVTHPSAGVLLPLDLHVLGLPLAFILSQDQTLHRSSLKICNQNHKLSCIFTILSLCPFYALFIIP